MPKLVRGSIQKKTSCCTPFFTLTNNHFMQLKKYSKNFKEDSANTTKAKFSHSRPHVVKLVSKPVLFLWFGLPDRSTCFNSAILSYNSPPHSIFLQRMTGNKLKDAFLIRAGLQVDGRDLFWVWNGYYYEVLVQTKMNEQGVIYEVLSLLSYPNPTMQTYSLKQRVQYVRP